MNIFTELQKTHYDQLPEAFRDSYNELAEGDHKQECKQYLGNLDYNIDTFVSKLYNVV